MSAHGKHQGVPCHNLHCAIPIDKEGPTVILPAGTDAETLAATKDRTVRHYAALKAEIERREEEHLGTFPEPIPDTFNTEVLAHGPAVLPEGGLSVSWKEADDAWRKLHPEKSDADRAAELLGFRVMQERQQHQGILPRPDSDRPIADPRLQQNGGDGHGRESRELHVNPAAIMESGKRFDRIRDAIREAIVPPLHVFMRAPEEIQVEVIQTLAHDCEVSRREVEYVLRVMHDDEERTELDGTYHLPPPGRTASMDISLDDVSGSTLSAMYGAGYGPNRRTWWGRVLVAVSELESLAVTWTAQRSPAGDLLVRTARTLKGIALEGAEKAAVAYNDANTFETEETLLANTFEVFPYQKVSTDSEDVPADAAVFIRNPPGWPMSADKAIALAAYLCEAARLAGRPANKVRNQLVEYMEKIEGHFGP